MNDKEEQEDRKFNYDNLSENLIKPDFSKLNINNYFYEKKIGNKDFNIEFIIDEIGDIWEFNKTYYKRYIGKDRDIRNIFVNTFKRHFNNNDDFLKTETISQITSAYFQYGIDKYKQLYKQPNYSCCFNNKLIYLGNNINKDFKPAEDNTNISKEQTETIKDSISINKSFEDPINYFFIKHSVKFDFKENTKTEDFPTIYKLIKEWLVPKPNWENPTDKDKNEINTYFEMVGNICMPCGIEPVVYFLTGTGSNGKTQAVDLIRKVLLNPQDTEQKNYKDDEKDIFSNSVYKNKLSVIIEEIEGKIKADFIKRVANPGLQPNREMRTNPNSIEKYAKTICLLNKNWILEKDDESVIKRICLLDFPNKFKESEDEEDLKYVEKQISGILKTIPEEEKAYFISYCVDTALRNLIQNQFKHSNFYGDEDLRSRIIKTTSDYNYIFEQYFEFDQTAGFLSYEKIKEVYREDFKIYNYNTKPTKKQESAFVKWVTNYIGGDSAKERTNKERGVKGIAIKPKIIINNNEERTEKPKEEYTKQEIFDYFVSKGKITKKYDVDKGIKILKDNNIIYEPIDGVYKLLNKGLQNE